MLALRIDYNTMIIKGGKTMHSFSVTTTQEIEADTAEEAALLVYQALTKGPAPLHYAVVDENNSTVNIKLDRDKAVEFSELDHTADPGNW